MAYIKYVWKTGEKITASKLNHMEDGIEYVDLKIDASNESLGHEILKNIGVILIEEPDADNTNKLKVVLLNGEPDELYKGYLYLITNDI